VWHKLPLEIAGGKTPPKTFCHRAVFAPQFPSRKNPVKPPIQENHRPDPAAQRQREFQLQQDRAFKSLNMLARGVVHDFNNVIAAIIGSAEEMKMDAPPDQPDNPVLDQILTAGSRASHMMRQLKIFSERPPCRRILIPLPPVVGEAVQRLRSSVPATVEIIHHLEPECPAVLADAAQIQQAVMSLGANAGHLPDGRPGRIEVRLETCDVAADLAAAHPGLRAGPHVRLSVRDNGGHFSKGGLERIFEPFACKQIAGHDSGLELFAVREIVHAHEGAITVDSAPGEGTVFRIYFPVPADDGGGKTGRVTGY
jgi:signal transduction histidine kinase